MDVPRGNINTLEASCCSYWPIQVVIGRLLDHILDVTATPESESYQLCNIFYKLPVAFMEIQTDLGDE
jgi:hypothetical protein